MHKDEMVFKQIHNIDNREIRLKTYDALIINQDEVTTIINNLVTKVDSSTIHLVCLNARYEFLVGRRGIKSIMEELKLVTMVYLNYHLYAIHL